MLNLTDYVLSLPLILLALFAIGVLVMDRMFPPEWRWLNGATALVGFAFAAGGVAKVQLTQAQLERSGIHLQVAFQRAMVVDNLATYFYYMLIAAGAIAVLIALRQSPPEQAPRGLFYAALMCAVIGLMCTVSGFNLGLIFGGVVLAEVSSYWLVRDLSKEEPARSACRRYMLLKMFSALVLGVGFLLLRWKAGSAGLHEIRLAASQFIANRSGVGRQVLGAAFALSGAGVVLRIAAIPFHQWNRGGASDTNDLTRQSLQDCVMGFMSAAFPIAAWGLGLHVFLWGFYPLQALYTPWLNWAAIALLAVGLLAVFLQTDLRRWVAYSTLLAAGFMLPALAAVASGDPFAQAVTDGLKAINVYLPAILFMNLGALAAITLLRQGGSMGEIADLGGLFRRSSTQAILLLIFLFSIAGFPALAGFYGKYLAYHSVSEAGHQVLARFGLAFAVIGLVSVLRIVQGMFGPSKGDSTTAARSFSGAWPAAILCGLMTVAAGIHPQWLIALAKWSLHLN